MEITTPPDTLMISPPLTQLRHEDSENNFFRGFATAKSLRFNAGVAERACSVNLPS
jgi:hypothetical protein